MLGNFVSRVTKFCRSKFGEKAPAGEYGPAEDALTADLIKRIAAYAQHWEDIEIRKAAAELRAIWVAGNEYLQAQEPWAVFKTDPDRAGAIIRYALNLTRLYAILSEPFIPGASKTIAKAMSIADMSWPDDVAAAMQALPPGHAFTVPENMFAKITDDARDEMAAKFAGE